MPPSQPKFNRFRPTRRERQPPIPLRTLSKLPSLYVTNLASSKIQKADLRTALYMLFSTYGPVLDVVALKTMSMRGQAHIVYRDVQTATQAMRSLEGQEFLGKQLVRAYEHFVGTGSFTDKHTHYRKSNMQSQSRTLFPSWTELSRCPTRRAPL